MAPVMLRVLDPNWSANSGGGGKGANEHYDLADCAVIAHGVRCSPEWSDVAPALVWMWATTTAVLEGNAHELARRLHLRICAQFLWVKVDEVGTLADGRPLVAPAARMGQGQWTRCEHEHLLVCRRGDLTLPETPDRMRSVIYAPRSRVHSEKPEAAWRVIERVSAAVAPGVAGVEINARVQRPGWGAWGRLDGEDKPVRFAPARPTTFLGLLKARAAGTPLGASIDLLEESARAVGADCLRGLEEAARSELERACK